jgi:hypothetical protein
MTTFDMKKIETILEGIVLTYSKGLSNEAVDNLFDFYIQQIERIKQSLRTDKQNKSKQNKLKMFISLITEISNENIRLKNHHDYGKSISKKF